MSAPDNAEPAISDTHPTNPVEARSEDARTLDQLRHMNELLLHEIEELQQAVARLDSTQTRDLRRQADAASAELRALKDRLSVRIALEAAGRTGSLIRRAKKLPRPGEMVPQRHPRRADVEHAIRAARTRRPADTAASVSIIIPTRDGVRHLRRLLPSLSSGTSYRDFEVVIVDNGSTDETIDYVTSPWRFPVTVISNPTNASFSEACNQGATRSSGDLLLFLNNDVEPITPHWLSSMVETMHQDTAISAVGALLVYSEREPDAYLRRHADFSVQHNGIGFTWRDGVATGINLDAGRDATDPSLARVRDVPAASAACLLVDRGAFEAVGGFSDRFIYGWEDVDLCMKLRAREGRVLVDGEAALFHYEFGTQELLAGTPRRIHYLNNRRVFDEMWGPRMSRALRSEGLAGEGFWRADPALHVGITLTRDDQTAGYGDWYTAHELGDALTEQGATVSYLEQYSDGWYKIAPETALIVNLLPDFDLYRVPEGPLKAAWIRNWPDRWLENPSFHLYDLAFVSTKAFAEKVETASPVATHLMTLATNPNRFAPGPPDITYKADYTFTGNVWGGSRDLANRVDVRPEEAFTIYGKGWDEEGRMQRHLRGELPYEMLPTVYRSVPIVLDDTVGPNRPALNSRVFDALAAGALVITDNVEGSVEWFGGRLPAAEDRAQLRSLLDTYLGDEALRAETTTRLREEVLNNHTYERRAAEMVAVLKGHVSRPRLRIKIGPPSRTVAPRWGDTHFALDFARALRRRGWATSIDILPEWDSVAANDADVTLHLRGLNPYTPKPGAVNVLWIISHPDDVTPEECERYDVVFVASHQHAQALSSQTSVPVYPLLQATDAQRFGAADAGNEESSDLLFVGNSRLVYRQGVRWALELDLPLSLWGSGWEPFLGHHRALRGEAFPNERLPSLMAAAKIVLNDHWSDMAERGFISNRIFDAAAVGAVVVTDAVVGLESTFGDIVPTYSTKEELGEIVGGLLTNDSRRESIANDLQEIVLAAHTFDHRAESFLGVVEPLVAARHASLLPSPTLPSR